MHEIWEKDLSKNIVFEKGSTSEEEQLHQISKFKRVPCG